MQAIKYLSNIATYISMVIPVGAGAMLTYFYIRKSLTNDENVIYEYNGKIRNTLIGAAVGLSLAGVVATVKIFFM